MKRRFDPERMDDPALDPAVLGDVLADLARVNRVTLAARPTLGFVRRAIGERRRFRLLDVGFGQGDTLRTIARWAQKRGIAAELVGIDLNPGSAPAARAATPAGMVIDYRTGDLFDLRHEPFDLIVSSLVAHHMSHNELVRFVRFMEEQAAIGWFVNDLRRSAFAHAAFPLLAATMRWHPIVRHDGRLSIARSLVAGEWPAVLAEAHVPTGAARVFRAFPFRLCVERRR